MIEISTELLFVLALVVVLVIGYFGFLQKKPPPAVTAPVFKQQSFTKAKPKEIEKEETGKQKLKILFGSQTGTAEDFAKTIQQEAQRNNFSAKVVDLEEYDFDELEKEEFVIFVMATYGDGEPTDNAKDFYEKLMEEHEPDLFQRVKYTVFGLGNKTYQHFNAVARAVDKRMSELGAQSVFERGEGDDDGSLEEDFTNWRSRIWEPVCAAFGVQMNQAAQSFDPRYDLVYLDEAASAAAAAVKPRRSAATGYDIKNPATITVTENRELHGEHSDRSCRHVEFDIGDLRYEPGDHLGVFAGNSAEVVQQLAERLGLGSEDLDKWITVKSKDPSQPNLMGPCTIRHALTFLCDLTSPPRKNALAALAQYASEESEKEDLTLLGASSPAGVEKYTSWIRNDQRIFTEVLLQFPSCKPPIGHVLELLPRLQPRFYSISSSLKANPRRVSVTAVLVQYITPTNRVHNGVATHYLAKLLPTDGVQPTVKAFIRKSTFHLPRSPTMPILMIGPGTGLAPFRGFIQERSLLPNCGDNVLYFGCRNRTHDFIYEDELKKAEESKLIKLHIAFSRETEAKQYVQHLILENKDEVYPLLQKGWTYICGDAKRMAKDVHKALVEVIKQVEGKDDEAALAAFNKIHQSGRFLQDVW